MMIKTRFFIALITGLLLCLSVQAEVDIVWTWDEGGSEGYQDQIASMIQLDDGSIVAAGWANSYMNIGHMDAWIGKFTSAGELVWSIEYDTPDNNGQNDNLEAFAEIKEAYNGGFIVVGSFVGPEEPWIVRLDEDGDTLWTITDNSNINSVAPTSDGGFVFGGSMLTNGGMDYDVLLVKVDDNGEVVWRQSHGTAGEDEYCTN